MPFFEKVGKKISGAGQSVAQQTRELAEVTRLNSAISAQEKKLAERFQLLGRIYYERCKDAPSEDDRQEIEDITAMFQQIQANRERIAELKGIVKCPQCGANVAKDAQYCGVCGQRIQRVVQGGNRLQYCIFCGAKLEEHSRFCVACGKKVSEDEDAVNSDSPVDARVPDEALPQAEAPESAAAAPESAAAVPESAAEAPESAAAAPESAAAVPESAVAEAEGAAEAPESAAAPPSGTPGGAE